MVLKFRTEFKYAEWLVGSAGIVHFIFCFRKKFRNFVKTAFVIFLVCNNKCVQISIRSFLSRFVSVCTLYVLRIWYYFENNDAMFLANFFTTLWLSIYLQDSEIKMVHYIFNHTSMKVLIRNRNFCIFYFWGFEAIIFFSVLHSLTNSDWVKIWVRGRLGLRLG